MTEKKHGQVITFYSYKGGTGRTMALANIATLLSNKYKVLVIDWDLEAPGLHYFFRKQVMNGALEKPGLIDLFEKVRNLLEQNPEWKSDESEKKLFDYIKLDDYLFNITENSLFLLAAGRLVEDYPRQVAAFQWETLFYRAPWIFRSFAKYLTDQYDYVLIDSRTGLNDISGICTALMPEKLIAVFTPSIQSITGIISSIKNALHYRKESDDLRPLNVFPLPSRLELQEKVLFDDWRFGSNENAIEGYQPLFEELLKNLYNLEKCDLENYFDNIQIQQFTYYAYGESIAVSETQGAGRLSLSTSYSLFTEIITNSIAPWTVQHIQSKLSLSELEKPLNDQISISRKKRFQAVRSQLRSARAGDVWRGMDQIRQWLDENSEDREVYGLLLNLVQEKNDLRDLVRNLMIEMMMEKESKAAQEALSVLPSSVQDLLADAEDAYYAAEYDQAIQRYRQVLRLDPKNERAKEYLFKSKSAQTNNDDYLRTELPREAVQYFRRARSFIAARDYAYAIKALSTAVDVAQAKGINYPEAENLLNSVQDAQVADEFRQKATLALENKQWKEALDLYNKALLLDPTNMVIKKELDSLQSLLKLESELQKKGLLKIFVPIRKLQIAFDTAKGIMMPDNPMLVFIQKQLHQITQIRIGLIVILVVTGFVYFYFFWLGR